MYRLTASLLALTLAGPVFAGDLSYNYVQFGYQNIEVDVGSFDVDGDNLSIDGSFEINDNVFVLASYATGDFDLNVDQTSLLVGAGYHVDLSPTADLFATLSYVLEEFEAGGFDDDEDGLRAEIGIRGMVTNQVELAGALRYVDFGDEDATSIRGDALYNVTDTVALGANLEIGEDVTAYGVGVRFYFGR